MHKQALSDQLVSQGVADHVGVVVGTDYPGGEVFISGQVEELTIDDTLAGVYIGESFVFVLDVGSEDSGLGGQLTHLIVRAEIVGLWVLEAEVVVFNWCGKIHILTGLAYLRSELHEFGLGGNMLVVVMGDEEDILMLLVLVEVVDGADFSKVEDGA